MKLMAKVMVLGGVLAVLSPAQAGAFSLEFEWGNIPLCDTGSPDTVPNPIFRLKDVPVGTKFINFSLTDLDVRSYDHGGGTVAYSGQSEIKPGAFTYESPCPPSGSHTYEWTARGQDGDGFFSGTTGSAKASKSYP